MRYSVKGKNHLLNGILFEIYFNAYGEFRHESRKSYFFEKIIALRKISSLEKSFEFIRNLLEAQEDNFIYLPKSEDEYIDIDIVSSTEKTTNHFGENVTYQVISSITYSGEDITKKMANFHVVGKNGNRLKKAIAEFFTAPEELIQIHSNLELKKIAFIRSITEEVYNF